MLKPSTDRLDYSTLLAPPPGFTLEQAIGTSYSLDFAALVGVCMALGLASDTDSALLNNPVHLLETLRRTGDRVALFCQAGQIHVPSNNSSLYILLEKMVFEVQKNRRKGSPSFHPKFWLIKYASAAEEPLYRTIILSRNLTFDRSWDVAVALDGKKQTTTVEKNQPLRDFCRFLEPFLPSGVKRRALQRLSAELEFVDFKLNAKEFSDYEFLPVGIPKPGGGTYNLEHTPLFAAPFSEVLIMSPFLSGSVIQEFNQRNRQHAQPYCTLITRRESLGRLSPEQCDRFRVFTMKDQVVDGETMLSDDDDTTQQQDIHAKLYLWRRNSASELYLGSLNASYSALHGNIEFMLRLVSQNRWLNTEKLTKDLFGGDPDHPDNPFELTPLPGERESGDETANRLEREIKELCRLAPEAVVETSTNCKYRVTVRFDRLPQNRAPEAADLSISPLLSKKEVTVDREVVIDGLALLQLSEFYHLTATLDGQSLSRVIKIPTKNIPPEREGEVVKTVIKDTASFYQYLTFLLSDDYLISSLENHVLKNGALFSSKNETPLPALYENMLKTAATIPEKFTELEYILKMVGDGDIIPDGFVELYHSFRKAVGLRAENSSRLGSN